MRPLGLPPNCSKTKTTGATASASASSISTRTRSSRITIVPAPSPPVRGTTIRLSANTSSTPPPPRPSAASSVTGTGGTTTSTTRTAAQSSVRPSSQWTQTPNVARTHPRPSALSEDHSANSSEISTSSAATVAGGAPSRSSPPNYQHHVVSVTGDFRSSSACVTNMPVGDRPRQPQLNATAARAINRNPLTPKIAAKGPSINPLARRAHSSTPPSAAKTTVSSPVTAFLATNVTPRSGSRQNRVDSVNSTPSGTPNPILSVKTGEQWENRDHINRAGLGILSPADSLARDSASPGAMGTDAGDTSKFFYADDAKSVQQAALQRPPLVPQKSAATFFYANRLTAEGDRNISPPSISSPSPSLSQPQEPVTSKFFFANGSPDFPSRPNLMSTGPGSTISSSSRTGSFGPPPGIARPGSAHPAQRPASPVKSASTPVAQTLKTNAASPPSPKRTMQLSSPPVLHSKPSFASQRRVSIDSGYRDIGGHKRTGSSATVAEPTVLAKFSISPKPSETASSSPPLTPGLSQHAMSMASILQAAEDLRDEDGFEDGQAPLESQSPTKSSHFDDPISDLVVNARRERKVQDLEITNASLEAINRTLERQLRKQTVELRRYRRLSRSGALSAASSRVTSLAFTEPPTDLSDVDDVDQTEEEGDEDVEDEEDEGEEDMHSFDDSDLLSNDSLTTEDILLPGAKLDARRRRDEKRLHLDLSRHQELLVDSQKMNQSLKRCLDFTQILIKEGQKALEYKVRVSDIKLGGRVLAPLEEEEGEDVVAVGAEPQQSWPKSSQDRDSGIELPTLQDG